MFSQEPDRNPLVKQAQGVLWYPLAVIVEPEMKTRGKYPKGYPEGAVVHYTAGHSRKSAISQAQKHGWAYFVIDQPGEVYQAHPLDRWGYHAGVSEWGAQYPNGVSKHLVGIEVVCAGKLTKSDDGSLRTWWGKEVPQENAILVSGKDWGDDGYYEKFTQEQEDSLVSLLFWLKTNSPWIFSANYVLGHHEVSPGRKTDPGGSLSMPMDQLREELLGLWANSDVG